MRRRSVANNTNTSATINSGSITLSPVTTSEDLASSVGSASLSGDSTVINSAGDSLCPVTVLPVVSGGAVIASNASGTEIGSAIVGPNTTVLVETSSIALPVNPGANVSDNSISSCGAGSTTVVTSTGGYASDVELMSYIIEVADRAQRSSKTRSNLRSSGLESSLSGEDRTVCVTSRRSSQRLAKQPSVEEIQLSPAVSSSNIELEGIEGFSGDGKIVRSCTLTRNNNNNTNHNNNNNDKGTIDEERNDLVGVTSRHKISNSKGRSNGVSSRNKSVSNHINKNNNNHLKEDEFEKHFDDKKYEDLQRKLTDSIRSRDEAAAAVTILPSELRPTLETNGSMELQEQQQRLHTTIDYRLSDSSNGSQQCINSCTVIAQQEFHNAGTDLDNPDDIHESKARVKLKTDSGEMLLTNGLEPMDTYIPIVGDIGQPLLDDGVTGKKVFMTDSSDSMDGTICNGQELEDKRRKRDDKKDDKNKKKKLKPLEEENLSKRLYETREVSLADQRQPTLEHLLTPAPTPVPITTGPVIDTSSSVLTRPDDERKNSSNANNNNNVRGRLCGECGARHVTGPCPFTRPTHLLPDSILPPARPTTQGVIVAPPHSRETPVNLSNGNTRSDDNENLPLEETWRDPQRAGSPNCYSRTSLPAGLALERRLVQPPRDTNQDDDVGVVEDSPPPPRSMEVVVARTPLSRYTQLGPVVGVPVRERDIPDDFSMVNLWEVFTAEGKRYISTVDPVRSNWTRFLRPAPDRDSANLVVVPRPVHQIGDEQPAGCVGGVGVFLVTTQDITVGEELVFWAHDPTLAWSRKKMEKTNCGGCNMKFVHPLQYRMHCSVFHDPNYSLTIRKYHCKVCGLAVLGKENIMRHAAEQHEGRGAYQCQFCKKFFLRLHSLDMHVTYSCSRNPARVFPLCDYCGKKFCQPQHLRSHQKRMHADMSEVLREFQCKMCFKILGSRAALQRHLKEVHHKVAGGKEDLTTGATCDRCGKMFQNKSNLKIHMLTHSGVKPFKCIENGCNAAFTTKQCLQFHYKKVHGYTGDCMPKIERCIPYTFDSYSGGLVPDPGRGKIPNLPNSGDPNTVISNPTSPAQSIELTPTTTTMVSDEPPISPMTSDSESQSRPAEVLLDVAKLPPAATLHGYVAKYAAAAATRLVSKGSRKWLGDSLELYERDQGDSTASTKDIYDFEERMDAEKRRDKDDLVGVDDDRLFRRESNASLLVEAALSVAELRGYNSGRCSPTLQSSQNDQLQLPQEAALATHIRYSTSEDEHRHLEYTLEREYDPRSLPEVMVVQENMSHHDLNEQLQLEAMPNSSSSDSISSLTPTSLVTTATLPLTISTNTSLATTLSPSSPLPVALPPSSTVLSSSLVNGSNMEPSLHVLEQLPALDMTYKQYRIVPETSVSHDHLLAATPLDENPASMGLEVLTSSGTSNIVTVMSPSRQDHLSEQLPLPELQPHDFRGLPALKSPDGQRSPTYLPSSPTHDVLRTYLIPTDALRSSSFTIEQGVDMSRTNLFIRYTSDPSSNQHRTTTIYELDRPPSHSLDLTLPRADQQRDLSPLGPLSRSLSPDPQLSPTTAAQLSPSQNQLSPSEHEQSTQNQLTLYTQLSSHVQLPPYSHITTLNQMSPEDRPGSSSPDLGRIPMSSHSPPDTTMVSNSTNGPPLPPISRIVSTSPFYNSRSRQDFTPTSLPSYSEPLIAGESSTTLTTVSANKDRPGSPYSQYPNSPYQRYQDIPSPPSYHYQYY